MIDREDALKMFSDFAKEEWGLVEEEVLFLPEIKMIKIIYDSIGSCGECKHYDKRPNVPNYNICLLEAEYRASDWYCADFERKDT